MTLDEAYKRWQDADNAWQAELVKFYGKSAGDARYDERGRTGSLEKFYREFHIARRAYDAVRYHQIISEGW